MERIRVGLIGANLSYSWGAKAHAPAFLALPEYELAAVCTAHAETARETAKHFGIPRAFHDYREMVQSADIDMVVVSVRVPFHHEMTIAALNAGKHVFCEWPLGANLAEATEMAALAKAKGLSNMVGLQTRCAPAVMRVKELVDEGYIGDVLSCHVTHILPGVLERPPYWADLEADPKKGANTLTIHAGHTLDALCFCVAEFQELSAQLSTQVKRWRITGTDDFIETSTPDNVMVQGVLTNGAVVSAHVGRTPWHGAGWRMEIYGLEGAIVISGPGVVTYTDYRLEVAARPGRGLKELPIPERLTTVPPEVPAGGPFNLAQALRRFAEGIREGKPTPPDFDVGVTRHHMIEAIERSSREGMAVPVTAPSRG